jgi:cytochrome c biogenesis protein CcdA
MTGLDVFAFVVMAVLLSAGLYIVFVLGALPGRIAAQREHPQADAIRVAGWVGILTLGVAWPLALIWAYSRATDSQLAAAVRRLDDRVAALESPDADQRGAGS